MPVNRAVGRANRRPARHPNALSEAGCRSARPKRAVAGAPAADPALGLDRSSTPPGTPRDHVPGHAAAPAGRPTAWIIGLAVVSIALVAINMFGGFAVTQRMLQMFRK